MCIAGRFDSTGSPAGKASRHLSGYGSQPELPQHAFSSFAAGKHGNPWLPSHPGSSSTGAPHPYIRPGLLGSSSIREDSPALEGSQQAFGHTGNGRSASPSPELLPSHQQALQHNSSSSSSVMERSPSADKSMLASDSLDVSASWSSFADEAAAADAAVADAGLAPTRGRNAEAVSELERSGSLPATYPVGRDQGLSLPTRASSAALKSRQLPAAQVVSPFKAASRSCAIEPEPSTEEQPPKRKVSAYFGGQPKRHKSIEAEALPGHATLHGLLGGLVSRLQPAKPVDDCDSSVDDDIDLDLEATEEARCDHEQQHASSLQTSRIPGIGQQTTASGAPSEAIAGLEHVQPFASIANVAVSKVRAASLKKFGMAACQKSGHARSVLQPFAPPRRCNASQGRQQHAAATTSEAQHTAPALQQFACLSPSST